MRIITVNIPTKFVEIIETLTGTKALYPSRSELVRVAVRDFLIHELEAAQSLHEFQQRQPTKLNEDLFVQVPQGEQIDENGHEVIKTYKLVKRS